jgi:UDP-N-acetylmuramyl pentapeptide phosphotransferase/UDP-N-acetylglucosamine-1-phosphate transferase
LLPAYYVTDATVTLLRRAFRGEKIWQAHSEHAYQRAVRAGWSHRKVVGIIAAVNMLLLLLAFAAHQQIIAQAYALVVGYGMSMASLVFFSTRQKS